MTTAPTLSSAIQIARGTCRAAPRRLLGRADARVEADEHPAADRECGQHSGADRAARELLRAERVREDRDVLVAEDEQQREPDPDRRDRLGRDPGLDRAAEHVDAQRADDRADEQRGSSPSATIAFGVGSMPASVSAQGAPRYATVVFATRYAQIATQPLSQPYVAPIRRRLHWYAPPAIGNSDASSA